MECVFYWLCSLLELKKMISKVSNCCDYLVDCLFCFSLSEGRNNGELWNPKSFICQLTLNLLSSKHAIKCSGVYFRRNWHFNSNISCPGHLILDEDLERTTFIVATGVIGPMDIVSIVISTTLELPTLENGAIRIIYPTLLTPLVTGQMTLSKSDNGTKSEENGYLWQMRRRL